MKRLFSKKPSVTMICLLAAALGSVIGSAYATCYPSDWRACSDAAAACIARGTNEFICEFRYERCLATKGCGGTL
ncbi:MAG: hypothetical protein KA144_05255 [Xanthomonadaceae bacterium]|nr:hypothetical protein [Xanthomonadaceae bacterium]